MRSVSDSLYGSLQMQWNPENSKILPERTDLSEMRAEMRAEMWADMRASGQVCFIGLYMRRLTI